MSINESDVQAARRILAEHEEKFAGIPKIQIPKAKTPIDHPDWSTKPDKPDTGGMVTTRNIPKSVEVVQRRHDTVVELTRQGYSSAFIADKLGITKRSVQRHRAQAGLSKPSIPGYTEAEIAQAQALLEDGASYLEVARTLQRGVEALRKRFPGYGWTKSQACMYGRMRRELDLLEVAV